MYSPEFMKFLINYQKPEYDANIYKETKSFNFRGGRRRFAEVLITVKK